MTDVYEKFTEDKPMALITLPQAALVGKKMNLLEVVRGSDATFEAEMRTKENWPYDLTGKQLEMVAVDQESSNRKVMIRKSSTDSAQIDIYAPTDGKYRIKFVPGDTTTMDDRVYSWSLDLIVGTTRTRIIETAEFVVLPLR